MLVTILEQVFLATVYSKPLDAGDVQVLNSLTKINTLISECW